MSEKPTVVELLAAVMGEVQPVGKGSRNVEFGYNFRGIDAVVNAVGPALRKHGVIVVPELLEAAYRDVLTSKGKPSRECTVRVRYRFYGPAGDFIDAVVPGESMDVGDKGAPKAMSVAYRIVLLQALCIPTDEPDPDSSSYERGNRDEWDAAAVRPPSDGQAAKFTSLQAAIAAAGKDEFGPTWAAIVAAYKADEITEIQANTLRAALGKRKEEVHDSASDSDRSSAEADPAGPGPVSGGVSTGDGGAGRGGEEGGVRPGVQSGVHRGGRGSRPPQASGDDRHTPAAVGQ